MLACQRSPRPCQRLGPQFLGPPEDRSEEAAREKLERIRLARHHTELNMITAEWVFILVMTCCTHKLISITHSLLHSLICAMLSVIIIILVKVYFQGPSL